ncbi:hypothetical protein [Pinibacter soli]|uniref:Uncharacterized protein n=1 Tax=Pinibacter soli TaxID=3044211 RepID=A0ABT6RHE0_9BACT|nr:hypothetical protein [Pinibacter soli]MDI3321987.1 hypothetical protein [Pinibacter soli]
MNDSLQDVDIAAIKKAKRRLFAEIELSDNQVVYYKGVEITKSDCEKVIDDLDIKEKKEYYYYLIQNSRLNDFLAYGDSKLFASFNHQDIYTKSEFVAFVNPFFAERFDKSLMMAFGLNDVKQIASILQYQILIDPSSVNAAFKSVSNEIANRTEEIRTICDEIKNGKRDCSEQSIGALVKNVERLFPIELVNSLPFYFQSQVNRIGSAINFLNLAIDEKLVASPHCVHLIEHVLKMNIDSIGRRTFQSNYEIAKERYEKQIEKERNAPALEKWNKILTQINQTIKRLENKTASPGDGERMISSINLSELNSLPSFASDLRDSFAMAYCAMAISMWNEHINVTSAINVVKKGLLIKSSDGVKMRLDRDLKRLQEFKERQDVEGKPMRDTPSLSTMNGIGTTIYGDTLFFVLFWIPVFPIARYNCYRELGGYRFKGKLKLHDWQRLWQGVVTAVVVISFAVQIDELIRQSKRHTYDHPVSTTPAYNYNTYQPEPKVNSTTHSVDTASYVVDSRYKGNQLKNGASPLSACLGENVYSGNPRLTVKNTGETDAIVCLYSISKSQTIRNSYVRAGSKFTIKSIPQGVYMLKVYYGNDWNPTLVNSCGGSGIFETREAYCKYNGTGTFEDGEKGYTIATLTLDSKTVGDAYSSSITQSKFFSN